MKNIIKTVAIAAFTLLGASLSAQNNVTGKYTKVYRPEEGTEKEDEKVYNMAMVEEKPVFPGGDSAMYRWISENLTYPSEAAEKGVEGRVMVQFEIDKDGSIHNVGVLRGRHSSLDAEAVRLVKAMPNWQPGRNNGHPVKVSYYLPISFKLQ